MLKRLLNGGEESSSIIFSPGENVSDVELLNLFLQSEKNIQVILTDNLDGLRHNSVLKIFQTLDFNDTRPLKDIVTDIGLPRSSCVVIKSLSGLLLHYSPTEVARLIKFLEVACKRVYCVIHEDCVDVEVYQCISKLCSTYLNIQHLSTKKDTKLCSIIHRKPSGKIVRSKEVFTIKAGHIDIETYEENKVVEEEAEDITDTLTTFKIGTNKSEKEVKNNLVLPFYTDQQKSNFQAGEVKLHDSVADNRIYYEPDSGDDWDDEDPDDDLDL